MKKDHTEIFAILDRSGSMASTKDDAIGGFNTLLDDQRKINKPASITIVQFDDEYQTVCENTDLNVVPNLTTATYVPRGATALLDAIGITIDRAIERYKTEDPPENVLFVIVTDGQENASHRYDKTQIMEKIKGCKESNLWEFVFLGTTQEAIDDAMQYGVSGNNTATYQNTTGGIRAMFTSTSNAISNYRSTKHTGDWKKDLTEDNNT